MPNLLIELLSEEIPARMQRKASSDLEKLFIEGISELGLTYESSANSAYEKIKLQNMPTYNVILKKIDEPLKIGDRSISTGLYFP